MLTSTNFEVKFVIRVFHMHLSRGKSTWCRKWGVQPATSGEQSISAHINIPTSTVTKFSKQHHTESKNQDSL